MRFATTARLVVPMPAEELWVNVVDVRGYRRWWPWLDVDGPERLAAFTPVAVSIPSPLGYRVRIELQPTALVASSRLDVDVTGDLEGTGSLRIAPDGPGRTSVEISWEVDVARPLLRIFGSIARPALDWGHRRVFARAVEEFVDRSSIAGPATGTGTGDSDEVDGRRPRRRSSRSDVLVAAAIAGSLAGVPSTLHAVATGRSVLAATRAAGDLWGRAGVVPGTAAHVLVSLLWVALLGRVERLDRPVVTGIGAGLGIAALDLGLVGRSLPNIRNLPQLPQVADHVAFGVVATVVLASRRRRSTWSLSAGGSRSTRSRAPAGCG